MHASIAHKAGNALSQMRFQYLVLRVNLQPQVPQNVQLALLALYANLMEAKKSVIQASTVTALP